MAGPSGGTDEKEPGREPQPTGGGDDLERRRRDLDAALSARRPAAGASGEVGKSGSLSGAATALKLSSEFIAGIVVGAGLGWAIDHLAGTSPFGLVVFLLLGFAAGVLNALRSAGLVAEVGSGRPAGDRDRDGRK